MATPFATAGDLADRLKRPVWTDPAELAQVEAFLGDASDILRAEIGWQVYPQVLVTIAAEPDVTGHIYLPGSPVGAVESVTADGTALAADRYELHNGALHVYSAGLLLVTYRVGYATPPPELVSWTCVLAAQMLARADLGDGGLGATPASVAADDVRVGFSVQQQAGDVAIPERALHRLRSAYGRTAYVT